MAPETKKANLQIISSKSKRIGKTYDSKIVLNFAKIDFSPVNISSSVDQSDSESVHASENGDSNKKSLRRGRKCMNYYQYCNNAQRRIDALSAEIETLKLNSDVSVTEIQ